MFSPCTTVLINVSRDSCPFLYSSFSLLVEDSVEVVGTLEVGGGTYFRCGGVEQCVGGVEQCTVGTSHALNSPLKCELPATMAVN